MNGIINMIIKILIRKGVNIGIDKGIGYFSKDKTIDENSPEAKANQQQANKTAKNAKQSMKVIRRIGRF